MRSKGLNISLPNQPLRSSFINILTFTRETEGWSDGGLVDDDLVLVDEDRPELLGQTTVKARAADQVQAM